MPTSAILISDTTLNNFLNYQLSQLPIHTPTLNFAFNLLYQTGCRAKESVNLDLWTINNNSTVTLKPLKFNNPRTFNLSDLPPDFSRWHSDQAEYLLWTSYRRIQYLGTCMFGNYQIEIGNKHSLLHLFRHNYIRKLLAAGNTIEQVQVQMGHTKINTTLEYSHTSIRSFCAIMTKEGKII